MYYQSSPQVMLCFVLFFGIITNLCALLSVSQPLNVLLHSTFKGCDSQVIREQANKIPQTIPTITTFCATAFECSLHSTFKGCDSQIIREQTTKIPQTSPTITNFCNWLTSVHKLLRHSSLQKQPKIFLHKYFLNLFVWLCGRPHRRMNDEYPCWDLSFRFQQKLPYGLIPQQGILLPKRNL